MPTQVSLSGFASYTAIASPPRKIGRMPESTPAERADAVSCSCPLPDDLVQDAARRLGVLSLLAATLWIVATVLGKVAFARMTHGAPLRGWVDATDGIALLCVLVSVAMFAYSRREDADAQTMLDLGLAYMVFTAAAMGVLFHWDAPPPDFLLLPEISWIGAVIVIVAAIVPNDPKKVLIAGLIAASMGPLGMLLGKARGTWSAFPAWDAILVHYPDFLLVGVAVVISRVMTKLGQQVTRARDMGTYRIGELLGSGGMGEVYRATHRMLARPAAIKLIRPAMLAAGDGQMAKLAVARFHREAEAAANLRSPHTVELYDFGVADDGALYFVMELLDGMDLETLVREHGPLPANRVIHILRQVCESLEEAHQRGLVHRDIKPANIHVGTLGLVHDFAKVLDFGLVKPITTHDDDRLVATAAGMTPGTPAYMAPEITLGEPFDGRADLYSLGCVAYYLLTGGMVFDAIDAMQMMAKHLSVEPVPPSRRTTLPVPAALDAAVLACLAKRPEERPRSAAELSRLLAAVQVEPWGEELAREWWMRNRRAVDA